jgi:hypothetical protein
MSFDKLMDRATTLTDGLKKSSRLGDWSSLSQDLAQIMGPPENGDWLRSRPPLTGCVRGPIDFKPEAENSRQPQIKEVAEPTKKEQPENLKTDGFIFNSKPDAKRLGELYKFRHDLLERRSVENTSLLNELFEKDRSSEERDASPPNAVRFGGVLQAVENRISSPLVNMQLKLFDKVDENLFPLGVECFSPPGAISKGGAMNDFSSPKSCEQIYKIPRK